MSYQITKLDLIPNGEIVKCNASQFDNGRVLPFEIYENEFAYNIPNDVRVELHCRKPDGNIVTLPSDTITDNIVTFITTTQLTACYGDNICEIALYGADDYLIGSANFILDVEKSPTYGGINSTSDIHNLESQIRDIAEDVIPEILPGLMGDYYTKEEVDTKIEDAIEDILPVDTAGPSAIASFTTGLALPLVDCKADIVATGGNGTPDNPNPINGYTEANITRCCVNLFDKTEVMDGYISDANGNYTYSNNRKCTDYIPIKGGEDYKILSEQEDSAWGAWYDSEKNYISGCAGYYVGGSTVKTAPANACFVRLTVWSNSSGNIDTFGLNYPATDTTYHAYNGTTHVISFGQTVYGGVLDVTRGKLTVTWTGIDLSSLNWYKVSAIPYPYFSAPIDEAYKYISGNTNSKCSNYTPSSIDDAGDAQGYMILDINYVRLRDEDYYNVDENTFKTAMSGVILAYELATPFDIDLTPVQIEALLDINNVFVDTNGNTTVKFKDTIQNYIDKKVSI